MSKRHFVTVNRGGHQRLAEVIGWGKKRDGRDGFRVRIWNKSRKLWQSPTLILESEVTSTNASPVDFGAKW